LSRQSILDENVNSNRSLKNVCWTIFVYNTPNRLSFLPDGNNYAHARINYEKGLLHKE